MKRNFLEKDFISGFMWLVLGIGLCIGSIELNLGGLRHPGPGLLPFLSGAVLVLLGLVLMFSSISKGTEEEEVKVDEISLKGSWKKIFFTILALLGYIVLFEYLGFFFTTFFFLFFLFKFTESKKWLMPLVLSLFTVILSYLIFSVWLRCQFPRGIFNFF
jgi:putative tricarboxylic transport membrane protein